MDIRVVVMGSMRWGGGPDLASAKRKFTSYGGKLSAGYGIFTFGEGSTFDGIDQMGRVFYTGPAPEFQEIKARRAGK